jgi:hypothetical protein
MPLSEDFKKVKGQKPSQFIGGNDPSLPAWVDVLSDWHPWFFFWERRRLERRWADDTKDEYWSYRVREII